MFASPWEFLLFFLAILNHTAPADALKGVWRRIEAVSGREAVLPCEVGASDASDMVYVVLWYRNGNKEPIYSYDNRPGRLHQSSEERHTIKSDDLLEGRVTFRPGLLPALHIRPVRTRDQANYTCRVDFRFAASRRTHLSLQVVVPPSDPVLMVKNQRVTDSLLGPLREDTTLSISCNVAGGVPPPSVVWIRREKILDDDLETQTPSLTINELNIVRLTRAYHNARLTCVATNNNVTSPTQASITITMSLRPLFTRVSGAPPKGLRVGQDYEVTCITAGSRPHPNVTWTLGNIATRTSLAPQTEHSANKSTSVVRFTALRRHHGQRLTCIALNPVYQGYPMTDSILLNVTYLPVATIELGRGVSSVVKEGEDIYFNCNVDANPPAYRISWFHKGIPIRHRPEVGILLTGNSLALRTVSRGQAGPYVCSASNVEGDAHSRPLNLSVNFAPVCKEPPQDTSKPRPSSGETPRPPNVYATGLGRSVNVSCQVEASPDDVRYSWVFNNSVASERIPGDRLFMTQEGKSVVHFLAQDHKDYGTLQCWAQNAVGRMTVPCLFHVVPAGRPEQPVGCSVLNKTYDSLAVGCTPGFDGGLEQHFLAKVYESVTGLSQLNVSSAHWPNFTLEGLTPGLDYVIQVVARNTLGESNPVRLEAFTYKMAENRMRDEPVEEEPPPPKGMEEFLLVGIVGVLLLTLVTGIVIRCILARRRANPSRRSRETGQGYMPPHKTGAMPEEETHIELPAMNYEAHRDTFKTQCSSV